MESKSHQIYRQRIEYAKMYVQTVYGALSFTSKYLKGQKKDEQISKFIGKELSSLNQPLSETKRIFNYSKTNICKYYIVELYKAFDEYLKNSIGEIFQYNPSLVLGLSDKPVLFTGADIVTLGNYKKICDKFISDIYRKLEDMQSTKKLLEKYVNVFKITIEKEKIDKALSVLELRHLVIHNNCKIDDGYQKDFPNMKLCSGKKIPTNFYFVNTLDSNLTCLIDIVDMKLIKRQLIKSV